MLEVVLSVFADTHFHATTI